MSLQLLDERLNRSLGPLAVVLMYEDQFGLLPELNEIFGEEVLIKFLDVFAGRTIKVPSRDVLMRRFRDIRIWLALSEKNSAEVASSLASEYGLDVASVRERYRTVTSLMNQFSITARSDGGSDTGQA